MELIRENDLRSCSLNEKSRVLCAFSGGADSTALLLELQRLKAEGRIASLAAAHFEHGIRGEESKADLAFCRETAEELGILFYWASGDVPKAASRDRLSLETEARNLRYAFLRKTADENGYDRIALAHHAQDQAETLLFHLIRGAGLSGLTGMAPKSGMLVRPLLKHRKEEILAYLQAVGHTFRTDSTNGLPDSDRNRIRLSVLPLLEELNPQAVCHLADAAEKLRREDAYLETVAESEFIKCMGSRQAILEEPEVIRDRILLRLIKEQTRDYRENDVLKLRFLLSARSGQTVELTGGIHVRAEGDGFFFFREETGETKACTLIPGIVLRLNEGATLLAEYVDGANLPCPANEAYVDADTLKGALTVRAPQPGERLIPFGMKGSKLFSDFYTDKKIPLSKRSSPVVFDREKPVYICGFTVDDRVRITGETRRYMHFIYSEGD